MIKRTAKAVWQGDLKQGSGSLELGSGASRENIPSPPVLRTAWEPTRRS